MTLRTTDLGFAHGDRPILHDVCTAFAPGKFSVILGPNGAGKSTLLSCLAGLLKPISGAATLDDRPVAAMPAAARAKAIGLLPQGAETHWAVTAEALVALGRYPHRSGFGLSTADRAAITAALAATRTTGFAKRAVTALSGGERARVLMARVLAGEAAWILADEPLANLDPGHQIDMLDLLRAQADIGKGVVAVLHDLHHAVHYADHVVLLHKGRIFAQGDVMAVITPANLAQIYGIDATLHQGKDGRTDLLIKGKTV